MRHLALAAALTSPVFFVSPVGAAKPPPRLDHVIVVVMENHQYDQVRTAPYISSLIGAGASFDWSYAVTHPSLPNYLALWSGGLFGVVSDSCPPTSAPIYAENLGHACEMAGLTWRAYSENLPGPGDTTCYADGFLYARKHAPWTYFSNLDHQNERPYADLLDDERNGTLPNLAFVVPNQCNDMHTDCGEDPISRGDTWLSQEVPGMLEAMGTRGLFILTWDEDDFTADNRILTVFVGDSVVANDRSPRSITHYTTLRTICEALGLEPFALAASESSITDIWAGDVVAAGQPSSRPTLSAPRPNPSRGGVSMHVEIPKPSAVEVEILDARGRRVRTLYGGFGSAGIDIFWDGKSSDGRRAPVGLYVVRARVGEMLLKQRLVRID